MGLSCRQCQYADPDDYFLFNTTEYHALKALEYHLQAERLAECACSSIEITETVKSVKCSSPENYCGQFGGRTHVRYNGEQAY